MAELPRELVRALERSVGFALRPVALRGHAQAEAFVAALREAGHAAELVAPSGVEWHEVVERLRRGGEGPVAVYGEAPVAVEALAALNRARDAIVSAHPHVLWWCGSDVFLSACAAAMPDFWSIRAPTVVFGPQEPAPPVVSEPLQPQTERDIHEFAEWLAAEFWILDVVEWSEPEDDGPESAHAIDVRSPELVDELRRMVVAPRRLLRFGEAVWADGFQSDGQNLIERLDRLGAFRQYGPGAARHLPDVAAGFEGPLLVPPGTALPHLRLNDAGTRTLGDLVSPVGRHHLGTPTAYVAHAVAATLGWACWVAGGFPAVRGWPLRGQSTATSSWHRQVQKDATDFLVFPEPGAVTHWPVQAPARALVTVAPGPADACLLPPTEAESLALVEAWLPDAAERDALLAYLRSDPHRAGILTDLGRLLPLLHSVTRLPTHVTPDGQGGGVAGGAKPPLPQEE